MNGLISEERRIKQTYAKRDAHGKHHLYTWTRADAIYIHYRQKAVWAQAFERADFQDLSTLEVLDVGCGTGRWLRMLLEWGATPSRLHGVDLLPDRIEKAQALSPPTIDYRVNNGWPLPYPDDSMNLCTASTVFSSILDPKARYALAKEMMRVTSHKSLIMVFDYAISDPHNRDTIGISSKEIRRLFPRLNHMKTYRLILAPPILRRIPRRLIFSAHFLEVLVPLLCTHRLYVLNKPSIISVE